MAYPSYIMMTQDGPVQMSLEDIAQEKARRVKLENSKAERAAEEVREERNRKLASCDWTQLPDSPVDAATWASYRQDLRDITKQSGFPFSIVWPDLPHNIG